MKGRIKNQFLLMNVQKLYTKILFQEIVANKGKMR
jgi:hypothetical protein